MSRYFVASHTAKGFVNFLKTNITNIKVIILSCSSLTIKTQIFQRLIKTIRDDCENIEILQNAHSGDFIDGFIVRQKSIAFIGDHIVSQKIDAAHVIELKQAYDSIDEVEVFNEYMAQAYNYLGKSLAAHEAIEKYYIRSMDFTQSDDLIKQTLAELFTGMDEFNVRHGTVYKRLFDSNALIGEFNLVPALLQSVHKRYFIRGGPGTGKSFFMKKILNACLKYGYNVEQYMCSYDPNSTDMIIIRGLNICMLDSSGPHEFSALSSRDQVIDLYETSRTLDVNKKFKQEINQLRRKQTDARTKGSKLLRKAGHLLQTIEDITSSYDNQLKIDEKFEKILNFYNEM